MTGAVVALAPAEVPAEDLLAPRGPPSGPPMWPMWMPKFMSLLPGRDDTAGRGQVPGEKVLLTFEPDHGLCLTE